MHCGSVLWRNRIFTSNASATGNDYRCAKNNLRNWSARDSLKLSHAIDQYLAWKRADDYKFEKVEENFPPIAKHIGDIELADVKPEQMLGFLNRIPILNSTWTGKYWVSRRFFRVLLCAWKHVCIRNARAKAQSAPKLRAWYLHENGNSIATGIYKTQSTNGLRPWPTDDASDDRTPLCQRLAC
jgi:hypothetical protein